MNIDWTDERAIGLKCWFARDSEISTLGEFKGVFKKISERFPATPFIRYDCHNNIKGYYDKCRLAQGEVTSYSGNGVQPVPCNVQVVANNMTYSLPSQDIEWEKVTHYQVQEMPEEKQSDPSVCPHNKLWVTCKDKSCIDALNKLEADSYCSHGFLAGCTDCSDAKTVPIKQSTISEIVECLEDARDATNELLGLELQVIYGNKRRVKIYQEEVAVIDKLIKELKDK